MTTLSRQPARSVADLTAGVILATVEIRAPIERVFRALTDPNELVRWWGSADTYRTEEWTADLRVGTAGALAATAPMAGPSAWPASS